MLRTLKIDPYESPNVALLNYADVARRFLPDSGAVSINDLDAGIQACLRAKTACTGLQVHQTGKTSQRDGNFLADTFNFRRHTETLGWNFDGLILLDNDLVIYKLTGGQPVIRVAPEDRVDVGGDRVVLTGLAVVAAHAVRVGGHRHVATRVRHLRPADRHPFEERGKVWLSRLVGLH